MANKLVGAAQPIVLVFCLVGAVLGQSSETIHVTDVGIGPVSLDGIVQFVGRKTICSVKAYNNADKGITALVAELKIRRPDGGEVGAEEGGFSKPIRRRGFPQMARYFSLIVAAAK